MKSIVKKILTFLFVITISVIITFLLLENRYPKNYTNFDCNKLPDTLAFREGSDIGDTSRGICWEDRAWYENKWEFCNNLKKSNADFCLSWMAIKLKDTSICNDPNVYDVKKCVNWAKSTFNEDTWEYDLVINQGKSPFGSD